MPPRSYDSPVREQQKADTHRRILDAVVRVVLDDGVHAFTVGAVAKRAGVAHRTVYRHFPTREALLEALAADLETRWDGGATARLADADAAGVRDTLRSVHASFRANRDVVCAQVVLSRSLGLDTPQRRGRVQTVRGLVDDLAPSLPEPARDSAARLLHSLAGANTWFTLTVEHGLSSRLAADTVAWSLTALLEDLRRRGADSVSTLVPPQES